MNNNQGKDIFESKTQALHFKGQLQKKQIGIYLLLIIVVDVRWHQVKSDIHMLVKSVLVICNFKCLHYENKYKKVYSI